MSIQAGQTVLVTGASGGLEIFFTDENGTREQIDTAKRAFRVFAQRRDEGAGDYVVPHTAITYVLDPAGRFIDHWPDSLDEDAVVTRLGKLLTV